MDVYLFEIMTPLKFTIHTTGEYWHKLLRKHPELEGKLDDIKNTIQKPTEI